MTKMETKCLYILLSSLRGGGSEKVCVTIANKLQKKGYIIRILTLNLYNAVYQAFLDPSIELINLNKKHARQALFPLGKMIKKLKIKKLLVFNYQLAVLVYIIKKIFLLDVTIISRNIIALSEARNYRKRIYDGIISFLVKKIYRHVDCIIALCQAMKDDLVKEFNIAPEKIAVINNPLHDKFIPPDTDTSFQWIDQIQRKKQLLFIGRLGQTKGIQYLLSIYKKLGSIKPGYSLKIVGKGRLKKEIEDWISENNYNNVIEMIDFTLDIDRIYKESDITLLTSLYEGFPNVLIESISTGTPVVSFDCPTGPSEIIVNGQNGYIARYLDEEDFVEKVVMLIDHPLDRRKVAMTARKYYPDMIIPEYEKVIFPGK